ncbi:MAG: hypothetical protein KAS04_00670, partial [Candidatus Aenigmarchaeota archaeon]|nr:hypothetical protein [Candidatus Aenigmarchaeota archaeon]
MIKDASIYSVKNSKGVHALKVKIKTTEGFYFASVPCGTSKGKNEALDISMKKAMEVFPKVKANLIGLDETDWITADQILEQIDPTKNWKNIGISIALGVSIAVAKASTQGELWRMRGVKS